MNKNNIDKLLKWFENNKRNLYWRMYELNDFQWIILELLLRRSKAEKVHNICESFFVKYKNPSDFKKVSENKLQDDLKPLGYQFKRCKIIKDISIEILDTYKGIIPNDFKSLCSIKHIGVYIASAYMTFKLNSINEPCIDTNVIRIMSRFYKIPVYYDNRIDTNIKAIVKNIAPIEHFKKFNYALLDLGGKVCKPKKPNCKDCPINNECYYFKIEY